MSKQLVFELVTNDYYAQKRMSEIPLSKAHPSTLEYLDDMKKHEDWDYVISYGVYRPEYSIKDIVKVTTKDRTYWL